MNIKHKCSTSKATPLAAVVAAALVAGPVPVLAQTAGLEEIIVTSRYREENIQTTPIAITAFTGDELELRSLDNVEDIGLAIPNAFFRRNTSNFGPNNTIGLRGLTQNDFAYAFEPAVAVYIDDVYFGTLAGSDMDLVDLERLEVLRGPQGTLFGKNSLGGSLRLISRQPQGDNTGKIQATFGSYDRLDFSGTADVSLIEDRLFARVTGASRKRDGYGKSLDFTCEMLRRGTPQLAGIGDGIGADGTGAAPDADLDPDVVAVGSTADNAFSFPAKRHIDQDGSCALGGLGGEQSDAGRVMFRFIATDDLEIMLAGDYSYSDDQPNVDTQLTPVAATGAMNAEILYEQQLIYRTWGIRYIDNTATPAIENTHFITGDPYTNYATFDDPNQGQNYPRNAVTESWGTSATVNWDATDDIHAKFITAYRAYTQEFTNDSDRIPIARTQTHYLNSHNQFQAELQVTGDLFEERLDWTLGGFYYDSESRAFNTTEFGAFDWGDLNTGMGGFGMGSLPNFRANDGFTTENLSGFVHVVFSVTDDLSISGGARYTDEKKTNTFDHGPTLTTAGTALEFGGTRWDWKVAIDYELNEDWIGYADSLFIYAQAATGARSEGATPRIFTIGQLGIVPADEVLTYELGLKTEWFDRRVRVNVAGYYSDYDPRAILAFGLVQQCSIPSDPAPEPYFPEQRPGGNCPPGTFFAGGAGLPWFFYSSSPGKLSGVELEAFAAPIDNLVLNYSFGYNKYKNTNQTIGSVFYRDPTALLQPKFNMSGGIAYTFAFADNGTITPRLDWFYQSKSTTGPTAFINPSFGYAQNRCPDQCIPAFSVFNARLTYESADRNWMAAIAATNVFDKFYWQSLGAAITVNSVNGALTVPSDRAGVASRPREWALTVERRF